MLASMTATIANRQDGDSENAGRHTSGTSITSSYADGVLTLSGVASLADYQKVLTTITYSDTASSPTAGDRTIDVVANDGILNSNPATATVTVVGGAAPSGYTITADDEPHQRQPRRRRPASLSPAPRWATPTTIPSPAAAAARR